MLGPGAFGRRDQEDQIGGAVGCTEVDLRIESSKPQGRGRDSLGAAVGNCDSAGQSGRGLRFASECGVDQSRGVARPPRCSQSRCERTNDIFLGRTQVGVE